MIYLRWLLMAIADYLLLLTVPFAAIVVSAFTREMPYGAQPYAWGWIWGTYDNPPQGDAGYVSKRAPFTGVTTGMRGYVNRVVWMIRNPLYGLSKRMSLPYSPDLQLSYIGNPNITDKGKVPGYYLAKLRDNGKLIGFELYAVIPYTSTRCIRARLGWKIMTDKFSSYGFAQFVDTFNPLDGYGEN